MIRGNISNQGPQVFWIMAQVLFTADGKIREDRIDWLDRVSHVINITIILKPEQVLLDHPYYLSYKTFPQLSDAQRALKRDPRPVCIISENVDSLENETLAFSDNILSRYSINLRQR